MNRLVHALVAFVVCSFMHRVRRRMGVAPDPRSRVVVAAADRVLYDSLVDGNEAYAPAGSYLFFAGSPGQTLRVTGIAP